MSASVLPSDRRAAEESGSDAFMGKPFIPRELIAVLERLVGTGASEPAGG
jgi:CheY-like chemotaxis protein